jgi:hypothetical protein
MKSAKQLLVLISALSILICAGCRKKPVEQPKPVSKTSKTQPVQNKAGQSTPKQTQITPAAQPNTPAAQSDINKAAKNQSAQKKPAFSLQSPKKHPAFTSQEETTTDKTEQSGELNINQFASLQTEEEKTEWISNFTEAHPDQIAAMAETAMNDNNAEVRSAALDAVIDNETSAQQAVEKGLKDSDEQIRAKAAEACQFLNDAQAAGMLADAINDSSEPVRAAAMQAADTKNADTQLNVYKAAINSKYEDVKDAAVPALVDMSSPPAVDTLIEGLKDPNPDFRNDVLQAIDFLVSIECTGYDDCKSKWNTNRNHFDEELNEKETFSK